MQPGRLADALRRGHHTPSVEDQDEWQLEHPNDVEQPRSLVGVCINQALSGDKGIRAPAQFRDERLGNKRGERRGPSAVREVNAPHRSRR